jgi:hypothetical protein
LPIGKSVQVDPYYGTTNTSTHWQY